MSQSVPGVGRGALFSEELGQNGHRVAGCGQIPLRQLGA